MQENKIIYLLLALVSIFLAGIWFLTPESAQYFFPLNVNAATSSQVTVSATVATTISCSSNITSSTLGTLTSSAVSTSTPNASTTISCSNNSLGCTLSINDTGTTTQGGGLWNSTSSKLIPSPNSAFNATATLAAGTEGYGIQGTTTAAGSGAALNIALRYIQTGAAVTNNVFGGLTTTTLTLASSTASSTSKEIVVTHGAAIAVSTPGGTYNDTVTYSCTAN